MRNSGLVPLLALLVASHEPSGPFPTGRTRAADLQPPMTQIELPGKTHPVPGRVAKIANVPRHPVVKVLVVPGDRVKAEQRLIELDADEAQADVRAKEAALAELQASLERIKTEPREQERAEARASLESFGIGAREARRLFERLERLMQQGAVPEQRFHDARSILAKSEAEERAAQARLERLLKRPISLEIAEMKSKIAAAQANLDSAKAELQHYTLTAPIAGVVSRLDVSPGTVSDPGKFVWGEILDLSEIDVHCSLTSEQADGISVGQPAMVYQDWRPAVKLPGKVAYVGIAADQASGLVPLWVRLKNPGLRCYIDVKIQLSMRRDSQ